MSWLSVCSSICNFSWELWNLFESLFVFYQTPRLSVLNSNHILSSELKLGGRSVQTAYLWFAKNMAPSQKLHTCGGLALSWGRPLHEPGGESSTARQLRSEEWHNVEVSRTTVVLLKSCCKTQYSLTYFHFFFFPRSKCNNATLFNGLLCDQLQCQRTICTPSWGMEAQCKYSLEMRAPIHMQTVGKLLLYRSHHTEVHIVPSLSF